MIHNIFLLKKIITIRDLTIMSFFKKKKKTVMLVGKKSIFIGDKLDPFQLERDINRASLFIKKKTNRASPRASINKGISNGVKSVKSVVSSPT